MLAKILELQNNAVSRLMQIVEMGRKKSYTFRAPTGSGKTYMMADFMNRMLGKHDGLIFLVSSLSKSDLAEQNYDKFCEYIDKNDFKNLNPYLINSEIADEESLYIPTDYNVYLLPRDLYKKNSRLMQGPMIAFLTQLIIAERKRIIWVKDECHIATSNLDAIAPKYFDAIVNFSATPKLSRGQYPDVDITDEEAERCKLIKTVVWGDEKETVRDALKKFQEIKEDYRNLLNVNPCLIIQISNKEKADEELQNEIFPALNDFPDLKWMLIVNDPKECDTNDVFKAKNLPVSRWKDYAKNNLSGIDVIIFKLVISEGWDIPRACMLYQARNSRSKQLDEQVIGRVRRNPRLLDFETLSEEAQKLALTAWVWGVARNDMAKAIGVKLYDKPVVTANIKVKTTRIKDLSEKVDFDLTDFLSMQKPIVVPKSIFDVYKKFKSADYTVQNLIYDYADNYMKWWKTAEHVSAIAKESNKYMCDYANSMEIASEESFAVESYYIATDKYLNISNWIWKRLDGAERFSFDSDAERDWAEILKDISVKNVQSVMAGKASAGTYTGLTNLLGERIEAEEVEEKEIFLWGKNYLPESRIKYEYYLDSKRSSYPDFVMKDRFGRIHIFEVKSVNRASGINIDDDEYFIKIEALKKCYKQASILTGYLFYLPVLENDVWKIYQYNNGIEDILTLDQFRTFVNTESR